jgi:signal transduction histidine kinase
MEKLFTPFFTTRPGGTGLGLPVARHIATLHGGSIHAENRPEGGSRFTIWLPV